MLSVSVLEFLRVLASDRHSMLADVTALDESGRAYLRLERAGGTASSGMLAMFAASGAR